MIVAITGGTGFVGRKLAQAHFEKGDTVRVLSRQNAADNSGLARGIELVRGDLLEKRGAHLSAFVDNADVLYHCAAELNEKSMMQDAHVTGTKNLLLEAEGRIGRWVQLSSVGVYGSHKTGKITELTLQRPEGEYEKTKAASDALVEQFCTQKKIDYSILRPSNIFGPTMTTQYFFQMINLIDRGLFFFIGPPGAKANYIHVDNVVYALMQCGKKQKAINQIFNLSDLIKMEIFVETISNELNKKMPWVRIPKSLAIIACGISKVLPGIPLTESRVYALTLQSWYPNDKIINLLDYTYQKSLQYGLREMVMSYKTKKA